MLSIDTLANSDITRWYYDGDAEAWPDLATAKSTIPTAVRPGKTIGIFTSGSIVEYWWPTSAVSDTDLVFKTPVIISDATPTHGSSGLVQSGGTADAIAAEATARSNADTAEATARTNADTAEATARSNADSAEATARANGDAATLTSAQAYADSLLVSVYKDCGNWNASTGTFPTSGGTGPGGNVKAGNAWECSTAGTVAGEAFDVGDIIRALVDAPGQTLANWARSEHNTQQATQTTRGTVKLATQATAIAATDDLTALTPLQGLALILDQKKNYFRNVSVSRGTPYGNETIMYYPNAGNITSIVLSNLTNAFYKTSAAGTYATLATPIAITSGTSLYIKFDYTDINNLNGSIAITGKDN